MSNGVATNSWFLQAHDAQLVRLGMLADRYFADDPNSALLKLRQLCELLAQLVAARVGLFQNPEEGQYELLRRLEGNGIVPRDVAQLFGQVRRAGNAANHALVEDHRTALTALKLSRELAIWCHRTFADQTFKPGPFAPPSAPTSGNGELKRELDALRTALAEHQVAHEEARLQLESTTARLGVEIDHASPLS